MALELPKDVDELYENFVKEKILEMFPENFNAIPAIKSIEDEGYKLKSVSDLAGTNYKPNELRDLMFYWVIPAGESDRSVILEKGVFRQYREVPVRFEFEKDGAEYLFVPQMVLDGKQLKLMDEETEKVFGVDANPVYYLRTVLKRISTEKRPK